MNREPAPGATIREAAPAKVNLVLHVGPRREDGLHELASLFASLELADELTFEPVGHEDVILCPGVRGPNLVAKALAAYRAAVPGAVPPFRVAIEKLIPVAAGLGGGSADAAAALRVANRLAGDPLDAEALRAIAATVGADVPSQVEPRHALVTGAGEAVEPVDLPAMVLVLVPSDEGLSTGSVYAEADRIGSVRPALDPSALRTLAAAPLAALAKAMENDLEAAALSLRPELSRTLARLEEAGALAALVSGSGPTAFGVFASRAEAETAAAAFEEDVIVTGLRRP
jgi:4-diphosphocytidyl-2-C-methyl-D-erythritol kinase